MNFVDTHSHIYLDEFNKDRDEAINRALEKGINKILLPNIDSSSVDAMLSLVDLHPEICYPMMGLHPTSVNENWAKELANVKDLLAKRNYIGIGEIGIDLYWDKTFVEEQTHVFGEQIDLAKNSGLPFVIHARDSFPEIFKVLEDKYDDKYLGIFHAFSGNEEQGLRAIEMGFKLGIGGVVTFKNAGLDKTVSKIGFEHLVLETDSPYLTPVPFRGKRNESAYIYIIAQRLADIFNVSISEIAEITTRNANKVFKQIAQID